MTRARGRRIAGATAALAAAVLGAAGFAARDRLAAEWWFHRLRSPDPEIRERAAERLGELGAAHLASRLIARIEDDPAETAFELAAGRPSAVALGIAGYALYRIGPACRPALDLALDRMPEGAERPRDVLRRIIAGWHDGLEPVLIVGASDADR